MNREVAIRQYFGRIGFKRFLEELKNRYESSKSGARGFVTLQHVTEEERETLDDYYGTYTASEGRLTKRYSIKQFETILKDSRFALSIPELLAIMSGDTVLTRTEQTEVVNARWRALVDQAIQDSGIRADTDEPLLVWASGIREETAKGARTLRHLFAKEGPEDAAQCLTHCLLGLQMVRTIHREKAIRLPILSAQITGDAHAFDWKYSLGRLFWWGLQALSGLSTDADFEEQGEDEASTSFTPTGSQALLIRDIYRRSGVADDDISSQVMLYAPGLLGQREERILTLRQVEALSEKERSNGVCIFMVENPSIFAELVDADMRRSRDEVAGKEPVIVCGNGQPSASVLRLLDWLVGAGKDTELWYAGDLDAAGLSIAQGLQFRYPIAFRAWFMGKGTYSQHVSRGIPMTQAEKNRVVQMHCEWDADLIEVIAKKCLKLHQELWVDELVEHYLERQFGERNF
ncbi:TIGR02679 domain-containing protein [Paenibacillus thermotolerans]|uniref:TIGR02679 domain-containing protein n=1 Tax=Paenibacillus thermotolerans TaxID=3027807 RepID=UPI002367DE85|nr:MULTISPECIES: TIGR02679 domain-containing protein [unclassified Paenibacillus]